MWKVSRSPLVKRKSSSIFPSLPWHLIFILCLVICPQAHSGQANMAYFAGGCFWCTEAVFERATSVTSVVSGYMQGAETVQVTFDPSKNQLRQTDQSVSGARIIRPRSIARDQTLESNIAPLSFMPMNSNVQQPRNRRDRRRNRTQNR